MTDVLLMKRENEGTQMCRDRRHREKRCSPANQGERPGADASLPSGEATVDTLIADFQLLQL